MLSAYFLTFGIFRGVKEKRWILKRKEKNVGRQGVERIRFFYCLPRCAYVTRRFKYTLWYISPVYSSGFPRLFRVLVFSLHSARRLLERTWRRRESQLPYPNFLKLKPLTCLNARRKTQKVFSLGRYQANFFLGTCVLEKYSKGAENGRKVELKLLTQGHHGG